MSSCERRQENHKFDAHTTKSVLHEKDHARVEATKHARLERHSATGRPMNERPKKGGAGGKGVWGSWEDDVREYVS